MVSDGTVPNPLALASKSQNLLRAFVILQKLTGNESIHTQRQLCILGEALRRIVVLRPASGRTHVQTDWSADQSDATSLQTIDKALISCNGSLCKIRETLSNDDASQAVRLDSTGKRECKIDDIVMVEGLLQEMTTEINTITLIAYCLELGSFESLASLTESLEDFCSWLLEHEILPNRSPPFRQGGATLNTVDGLCGVFKNDLSYQAKTDETDGFSTQDILCPSAELLKDTQSLDVKFRCHCEKEDHTDLLSFRRIPILEVGRPENEGWRMILIDANGNPVSIRIELRQRRRQDYTIIQTVWNNLACRLLLGTLEAQATPSSQDVFVFSDTSVSVLNSRALASTFATKLSGVTFILGGSFDLPVKPGDVYLQLLHYASAPRNLVEDVAADGCRCLFTDDAHFSILIGEMPLFGDRPKSSFRSHVIQIYQNTIVKLPNRSRIVTVEKVTCFEEGPSQPRQRCTEAIFKFQDKDAATAFYDSLDRMKKLLQEKELQGPIGGEQVLFQRESGSLTSDDTQRPTSRATVVYHNSQQRDQSKIRVILTRDGYDGSVSLTVPRSFLESLQRKPPFGLPDQTFWVLRYDDLHRPTISRRSWENLLTQRIASRISYPQSASALAGTAAVRDGLTSSTRWFNEWEELEEVLRTKETFRIKESYKPVKIAVIDTSVDPSRKVLMQDFIRGTIGKQNFKHGTQSVDLIWKMYHEAEIIVARVFENDQASEEKEPKLMAEAIHWAVENAVDIISISAGFSTCPDSLRDAVHAAHAAKILVFAAASNWGNTDLVAYPARIKDHVFCIFASTGALKSASDINPEPRQAADNFAVLGQHINLGSDQNVSGTSAATALAAGLAARVLDFSRNTERQDEIRGPSPGTHGPSLLRSKAGMTAVFRAMARRSWKYDCIHPIRMLQPQTMGDKRAQVREFLSLALRNID